MVKKYPIGTKIRFIANNGMCSQARQDDGKVGVVTGETLYGNAEIYLLDSVKESGYDKEHTWNTGWENIKPLIVKGQQLEFEFMSQNA